MAAALLQPYLTTISCLPCRWACNAGRTCCWSRRQCVMARCRPASSAKLCCPRQWPFLAHAWRRLPAQRPSRCVLPAKFVEPAAQIFDVGVWLQQTFQLRCMLPAPTTRSVTLTARTASMHIPADTQPHLGQIKRLMQLMYGIRLVVHGIRACLPTSAHLLPGLGGSREPAAWALAHHTQVRLLRQFRLGAATHFYA
jgi:hypothetical protein